jgi:ADP-ribose pyrophosphatase YjhB (NUDIX family)
MKNHTIDESWFTKPAGVREKVTAGGVVARVENGQVKIAVIEKESRGGGGVRFSLPKGKVKEGETLEETAVREISEETGINDLQFIKFLEATERLNRKKKAWKVNHFYLFVTQQIDCTPLEDDKTIRWFPIDKLPQMFWSDQSQLLKEHRQEIVSKVL